MAGDLLDEARRDARFFLKLAQRAVPAVLALVQPALRHLPRLVAIIDPPADPHEPLGVDQHHSDPATIKTVVRHARSVAGAVPVNTARCASKARLNAGRAS